MHLYPHVQQSFITVLPSTKHYANSSRAIQNEQVTNSFLKNITTKRRDIHTSKYCNIKAVKPAIDEIDIEL